MACRDGEHRETEPGPPSKRLKRDHHFEAEVNRWTWRYTVEPRKPNDAIWHPVPQYLVPSLCREIMAMCNKVSLPYAFIEDKLAKKPRSPPKTGKMIWSVIMNDIHRLGYNQATLKHRESQTFITVERFLSENDATR